ncbi:MAG: hypothetical protein SF052_15765 [Bacteroidia bacterium]|nr:hypothetical protein [Bacteroidia bacterium]
MKYYQSKEFTKLLQVFLENVREELEKRRDYEYERTEKWANSEKGEEFIEKTEILEDIIEVLEYY